MLRIVEKLRKQRHTRHRIVNNQKAMYSVCYCQNTRGIQGDTVFTSALGHQRSSDFNSQSQREWHMNPVLLDREGAMAFQTEKNYDIVRFKNNKSS